MLNILSVSSSAGAFWLRLKSGHQYPVHNSILNMVVEYPRDLYYPGGGGHKRLVGDGGGAGVLGVQLLEGVSHALHNTTRFRLGTQ